MIPTNLSTFFVNIYLFIKIVANFILLYNDSKNFKKIKKEDEIRFRPLENTLLLIMREIRN